MRWIILLATTACVKQLDVDAMEGPLDTVLVPGCPSNSDGTLSNCQWDRALWAHELWKDGVTRTFITSGNAVHNSYIEAEALRAGMVALGVPDDVIYTETQALHSDENVAYAIDMMEELGMERFGIASHPGHTGGMRAMAKGWGYRATPIPLQLDVTRDLLDEGVPTVQTQPVPRDEWLPLQRRERVIAARLGFRPRLNSFFVYVGNGVRGVLGGNVERPRPPTPEPTLRGRRHRVDTEPWDDGAVSL